MPMCFPGGQASHADGRPYSQEETVRLVMRMIPGSGQLLDELVDNSTTPGRRTEIANELAAKAHESGELGSLAVELMWGLHARLSDAQNILNLDSLKGVDLGRLLATRSLTVDELCHLICRAPNVPAELGDFCARFELALEGKVWSHEDAAEIITKIGHVALRFASRGEGPTCERLMQTAAKALVVVRDGLEALSLWHGSFTGATLQAASLLQSSGHSDAALKILDIFNSAKEILPSVKLSDSVSPRR